MMNALEQGRLIMGLSVVLIALGAALVVAVLGVLIWRGRKNRDPATRYRRNVRALAARRRIVAVDSNSDDIWSLGASSDSRTKKAGAAVMSGVIAGGCGGCGGCGCGG